MSEKQELIAEIVTGIERELAHLSLNKSRFVYTWPIGPDVSGWLGLNLIRHRNDGLIGINPIVGVRSDKIEALVEEFSRSKQSEPAATISISIGYLMPEKRYLEWLFEPKITSDYRSKVTEIARTIEAYGIPFMDANVSLETLTNNLEHLRFSFKDLAVYRLPVAYIFLGKISAAKEYVSAQLDAFDGRQDEAAAEYRTFAARLLQSVATDNVPTSAS